MKTAFQKIALFNSLIGNPNSDTIEGWMTQFEIINEEYKELRDALAAYQAADWACQLDASPENYDLLAKARKDVRDGCADVLVTVYGLCHRAGIDADADLEAVSVSNMSKFIHGTQEDAIAAGVEIHNRTGLIWREDETAPGIWAITSAKNQQSGGKDFPEGKLLKPASFVEPVWDVPTNDKPTQTVRNAQLGSVRGMLRLSGVMPNQPSRPGPGVVTTDMEFLSSEVVQVVGRLVETQNTIYVVENWLD